MIEYVIASSSYAFPILSLVSIYINDGYILYSTIFVKYIYPIAIMLRLALVLDLHPTDIHHIQCPKSPHASRPLMVGGAEILCIVGAMCCTIIWPCHHAEQCFLRCFTCHYFWSLIVDIFSRVTREA